jgi:hypothetical protein
MDDKIVKYANLKTEWLFLNEVLIKFFMDGKIQYKLVENNDKTKTGLNKVTLYCSDTNDKCTNFNEYGYVFYGIKRVSKNNKPYYSFSINYKLEDINTRYNRLNHINPLYITK